MILIDGHPFVPLDFDRVEPAESERRARELRTAMSRRRSVRQFSDDPVPRALIADLLTIAASAPSGAHRQPWTFVAVSDLDLKHRLRAAAEEEERDFYAHRAPPEWLAALAPLGTDAVKEHLTTAPWVIVLFRQRHALGPDGAQLKHYYSTESCGIAAGFLIAAAHLVGLATLPHTPSPMGFLAELLERPPNEQAMLVLPVGYPAPDAVVPDLSRKPLDDVAIWR